MIYLFNCISFYPICLFIDIEHVHRAASEYAQRLQVSYKALRRRRCSNGNSFCQALRDCQSAADSSATSRAPMDKSSFAKSSALGGGSCALAINAARPCWQRRRWALQHRSSITFHASIPNPLAQTHSTRGRSFQSWDGLCVGENEQPARPALHAHDVFRVHTRKRLLVFCPYSTGRKSPQNKNFFSLTIIRHCGVVTSSLMPR